jgi:hypothetical protein
LIRNNFYRLKLYEIDKYFKLIEIKNPLESLDSEKDCRQLYIFENLFKIFYQEKKKIFIAGGSLISKFVSGSDIDIFLCCTEEEGNEILKKFFEIRSIIGIYSLKSIKISGKLIFLILF